MGHQALFVETKLKSPFVRLGFESENLSRGCAHLFRPRYPDFLHGAPPTAACAAFIKESRMKFANAIKLVRKSGVR
jgi:hypothetical protein